MEPCWSDGRVGKMMSDEGILLVQKEHRVGAQAGHLMVAAESHIYIFQTSGKYIEFAYKMCTIH